MVPQKFTVYANQRKLEFESPYTDEQSLDKLCELLKSNRVCSDFAKSLVKQSAVKQLSDKQMAWVHKLVVDYEQPKASLVLPNITKVFETAKSALKYPKMYFGNVRLALRNNMEIQVKSDAKLVAVIKPDGELKSFNAPEDVITLLKELNADTAGYAAKYGKLCSHCCFCHKQLTNPSSLAVGYGPDCASNYNLPWGN